MVCRRLNIPIAKLNAPLLDLFRINTYTTFEYSEADSDLVFQYSS